MEKHYLPIGFELVVAMPNFVLDTEVDKPEKEVQHFFLTIPLSSLKASVEASVEGAFITERLAKGDMHVRWMAKKIDYQTPMFNDSVIYREVHSIEIYVVCNIYD